MKLSKDDFRGLRTGDSIIFESPNAKHEGDEFLFDGKEARLFKVTGIAFNDGKVFITLSTSSTSIGVVCWDEELKLIVGHGIRWSSEEPLKKHLKMLQSENVRVVKKQHKLGGE